jgi:hypothetical protein
MKTFADFREIWIADFEFLAGAGERPVPVCLVARELRSAQCIRLWQDDLARSSCPYSVGPDVLFVAYFASAELGCHRVLGWPDPTNICDLYVEYSNLRNGGVGGRSLLDAALAFRLVDAMSADDKDRHRQRILQGGPWSQDERREILDYCDADVRLTADLFHAMQSRLSVGHALLRGQFMAAVATIEYHGIPVDRRMLTTLQTDWDAIKDRLIARIDQAYGVFDGNTFKHDRFANWLQRHGMPWPRLDSGHLDLSNDTFRQMARTHPSISPLRELRHALSQMRLSELAVGTDDRNRCLLSPFRARTGRNAPSNSKFIFGPSVWLRQLIRPAPGMALAYADYAQQEFGIAAALSGDAHMQEAYRSGDPYLTFAKQAGALPPEATKATHGPIRDLYKLVVLGTQYGMHSAALATKIGQSQSVAQELLRQHRVTYATFWRWSDGVVDFAMQQNVLYTVFDWRLHVGPLTTDRTLRNFPMQANGSECLRLACVYALRRGVKVIAPVHDALLIEAREDQIDHAVWTTREAMRAASAAVLGGFSLTADAKVIRYPDRYTDPRGVHMWNTVQAILSDLHPQEPAYVQSRGSSAA